MPPPRPGGAAGGVGGGISIIKVILILVLIALGIAIGGALLSMLLLFTGSPAPCAERAITPSTAASQQLRNDWRTFSASAATGPATVRLSEQQVTSRAAEYVRENDAPIEDVRIYLCGGDRADAAGKVEILGRKVPVVARGTLDLSGPKPRIRLDSVRAGNLPSAVARPVVERILDRNGLRTLDVEEHLTGIDYGEGTITIRGEP